MLANMTSRNSSWTIAIFIIMCLLQVPSTYSKPHNSWPPYGTSAQFNDDCKTNEDVETLCQTCAKQTRSNIVYPMCCEEREDARSWCERYMAFGRSQNS